MEDTVQLVSDISKENHPRKENRIIQYGTAGFRTKGAYLDHVLYRMGVLASLRSKSKCATIGVMITASHNPEEDNGVKLVDPAGEMLEVAWESIATQLVNASESELGEAVRHIIATTNVDLSTPANVVFARDTRPSSGPLSEALRDGIKAMSATFTDYGVLTTPQLHYMVRCINSGGDYGQPTEEGYNNKLISAFSRLWGEQSSKDAYVASLTIDGANGVGAIKMKPMQPLLEGMLDVTVVNDGTSGKLNHMCGADFVKVQQRAPEGVSVSPGMRYASFDGDADRIVYFYHRSDGKFCLMDGDKIATLVAGHLQQLVKASGLDLNLGLVQTAYANGSSTRYITEHMKIPVACVPTGVKHLHHRAHDFDIGVYFEANGHGTVLFSDSAIGTIAKVASNLSGDPQQRSAAAKLAATMDLINQTVGDAISDLLLVETVLHTRGWSIADWDTEYTDLPNRQCKVRVSDRTVISTTDAERRATTPAGLQDAVDSLVTKYSNARSFVRPSGTEDVVRVYAEADTQENADKLAREVSLAVYNMAGGVGDPP